MSAKKTITKKAHSERLNRDFNVEVIPSNKYPDIDVATRSSVCDILHSLEDSVTVETQYIPSECGVICMHGTIKDDAGTCEESYVSYNVNTDKNMDVERLFMKLKSHLVRSYCQFDNLNIYGEDCVTLDPDEEVSTAPAFTAIPAESKKAAAKVPEAKAAEAVPEETETYQEIEDDEEGDLPFDVDEPAPAAKPVTKAPSAPRRYGKPATVTETASKPASSAKKAETKKKVELPEGGNPEAGEWVIPFGAHTGKTIRQVYESGNNYLSYMIANTTEPKGRMKDFLDNAKAFLGVA